MKRSFIFKIERNILIIKDNRLLFVNSVLFYKDITISN